MSCSSGLRPLLLAAIVVLGLELCAVDSAASAGAASFTTIPPGSALPSSRDCAARVRPSAEVRRTNTGANETTPPTALVRIAGARQLERSFAARVNGSFNGTTDEIIQWAACKWGLDEDVARAVAVHESWWRQSTKGNPGAGGYRSFGLYQINRDAHPGTWPASQKSTPFNADYALAWWRACYEGDVPWLDHRGSDRPYAAGDVWGCLGAWNSGAWYDVASVAYIVRVDAHLRQRTWSTERFRGVAASFRPPWPWR